MIRSDRVTLRPILRTDLPHLRRWHDDPDTMQYWGERMPLVTEGQWEEDFASGGKFTKFDQDGHFIIGNEEGAPIGRISFNDYDPIARNGEMDILIGEPEYRGKGYGSEAIVAFGHWFFNEKGAHRLWLVVFATNLRAQRAYEKVGFVREGTWREQSFLDGRWVDEHIYGLLRREFNTRYRPDLAATEL